MRSLVAALAVLVVLFAASGCGGTTRGRSDLAVPPSLRGWSTVARHLSRSLDDPSVETAEVYGPASYAALVDASENVKSTAERIGPFYLVVVHGRFTCDWCSRPPGGKSPTGRTAAQIWSPAAGLLDLSIRHRDLPATISQLGTPRQISIR